VAVNALLGELFDEPYELQSRLADVDHQVSYEFADFLIMHLEIRDEKAYVGLQDDLLEVLKNQAI
jgi:hypothetical protein